MDELLSKAGSQAVTFAIRSGLSVASAYAVKSVSKFIQDKVPPESISEKDRARFVKTKSRLQTRIEIVSSAIDLIKLVAARGNSNLNSTLKLIKDLKLEIDEFDTRINDILSKDASASKSEVLEVESNMLDLLSRIEETIPLINLSLTTSGANLNGSLSAHVSPGRLLQSSNIVNKSNDVFNSERFKERGEIQVGSSFVLTLYSIFYHRGRQVNNRLNEISWKENFTKADVSVWRKRSTQLEYQYFLRIKESFDDGRYHDEAEEAPKVVEIDVGTITRLFFSASGKLLKLEDRSSPVLVLKINHTFDGLEGDEVPDSDDEEEDKDEDEKRNWIEWLALGEFERLYDYSDDEESDVDDANEEEKQRGTKEKTKIANDITTQDSNTSNSISLLEYLLRLCVLQANDQRSILEIDDERLSLYLHDENPDSTGSIPASEEKEGDEFDNSADSTPAKIIGRQKNTTSLSSKLEKVSIADKKDPPSTPSKAENTSTHSPIPGELSTSVNLTPWERDKISRFGHSNDPQTPSVGSFLRKKVLQRNLQNSEHP